MCWTEFWENHFQCRYPSSSPTPYNQVKQFRKKINVNILPRLLLTKGLAPNVHRSRTTDCWRHRIRGTIAVRLRCCHGLCQRFQVSTILRPRDVYDVNFFPHPTTLWLRFSCHVKLVTPKPSFIVMQTSSDLLKIKYIAAGASPSFSAYVRLRLSVENGWENLKLLV